MCAMMVLITRFGAWLGDQRLGLKAKLLRLLMFYMLHIMLAPIFFSNGYFTAGMTGWPGLVMGT